MPYSSKGVVVMARNRLRSLGSVAFCLLLLSVLGCEGDGSSGNGSNGNGQAGAGGAAGAESTAGNGDPELPVHPDAVKNFTSADVNELSPTFGQIRSFDEVRDKVMVLDFTLFH
jgi:hypothetical protein